MNNSAASSQKVDQAGVLKLMQGLNLHKAEGPVHIPTRFLKEFAAELSPAMTLIFQASLQQGEVPDDWKQANVAPIFKKGDRCTAANYRPISLTSVCSKILEHIIHSQIMRHLDIHQILSDQQHGFRKKRSCENQLIPTVQDLAAALQENEQMDAILLDFSKAFDKVSPSNWTIMGSVVTYSSGLKASSPTEHNKCWLKATHPVLRLLPQEYPKEHV